jgi:TatA/E family protein of Tat protein translocase
MPTPGPLELVIILVIALLILGPGKLPDVGAALGKSIREFRKASTDVQDAVKINVDTSPLPPPAAPAAQPTAVPVAIAAPVAAPDTSVPIAAGVSSDSNAVTK